jgi:hypothetical protein
MFFSKNEVIELAHGKKYIVLDTTKFEGKYYYYVVELTGDEKNITNNFKVITTVSENGNLFVKTVKDDLYEDLVKIFKKNLNIR